MTWLIVSLALLAAGVECGIQIARQIAKRRKPETPAPEPRRDDDGWCPFDPTTGTIGEPRLRGRPVPWLHRHAGELRDDARRAGLQRILNGLEKR